MAYVNARYPGQLNELLQSVQGYIKYVLRTHAARWAARMGYEEAYSEALYGAMRGAASWLIRGGSEGADVPTLNTFVYRGIVFHFCKLGWHVGPVKVPREYPSEALRQYDLSDSGLPVESHEAFAVCDGRIAEADERDAHAVTLRRVRVAIKRARLDRLSWRVVCLRIGIYGEPLSYSEIGARLSITRQAAHHRFRLAIPRVLNNFVPCSVDA